MKKILILATVVALVAVVYIADRKRAATEKPAVGATNATAAPHVVMKDLQGRDASLEQYRGKVVLVNFWATWCGPCRIEIPWMIEFQEKYGPRGFTVLGVAMDDEGASVVAPYVQNERFDVNGQQAAINYPILLGNDTVAEKFGGLIGIPTTVLISREGRQVKKITGLISHDDLTKEIENLL